MAWHDMALNLPLMVAYPEMYSFPYVGAMPEFHICTDCEG